jgi:hypothetical protein
MLPILRVTAYEGYVSWKESVVKSFEKKKREKKLINVI